VLMLLTLFFVTDAAAKQVRVFAGFCDRLPEWGTILPVYIIRLAS